MTWIIVQYAATIIVMIIAIWYIVEMARDSFGYNKSKKENETDSSEEKKP